MGQEPGGAAGRGSQRPVTDLLGGEPVRPERVGPERGGAAGRGGHLAVADLLGGEPAGPGDRPHTYPAGPGDRPYTYSSGPGDRPHTYSSGPGARSRAYSSGPGDRPLRYLAAGLGAEELAAGDPARAGTAGLSGAERKTAEPGPEAPGEVTVTIGRIDVRVGPPRSTAGPAAAAPQPGGDGPARPGPSRLEDYLRARSSGRVG